MFCVHVHVNVCVYASVSWREEQVSVHMCLRRRGGAVLGVRELWIQGLCVCRLIRNLRAVNSIGTTDSQAARGHLVTPFSGWATY